MRLLHTADWHLGRRFGHWDLLADQIAFLDWLVEVVRTERVDAVLVAGDVFDRAVPPQQAVEAADEALGSLVAAGVPVVVISGNHDSAARLAFGAGAMAKAGLHIRGERRACEEMGAPVELRSRAGEAVKVVPVPYADPLRLDPLEGLGRTHHAVVERVVRQSLAACGCDPATCIVMGHVFVTGAAGSDSERALSVGGTSAVGIDAFGGAGYVALGHLHRPQAFDGGRVAYSGSPLAYSFSEEHEKQVRILDVNGRIESRTLEVDVGRPVRTLRGTLEQILHAPEHAAAERAFVRVELADAELQLGAMEKVRRRFPFAAELAYTALAAQGPDAGGAGAPKTGRSPADVVAEYVRQTLGGAPAAWIPALVDEAFRAASGDGGPAAAAVGAAAVGAAAHGAAPEDAE